MPYSDQYWMFTRAAVAQADYVFVLSFIDNEDDDVPDISQLLMWSTDELTNRMINWQAIGICIGKTPDPFVVILGPNGEVAIGDNTGFVETTIDESNEGPQCRGILRDVRFIGDHIYVTGMGRQVYRRGKNGLWRRFDEGVVTPITGGNLVGFNSIDGFSDDDIYAVGWGGEIWLCNKRNWKQINSPTNLKLERVICAENDNVYAIGQGGIILVGKYEKWQAIEQNVTSDQFWGSTWYKDNLWVATSNNVYMLLEDKELQPIDFGTKEQVTCGWLDSRDGVMWSVGSKHLFYTSDGKTWTQVFTK